MAMKRILNKTSKTFIIAYNDGRKFLKIKPSGVTTPLPENHPVFLETSLGVQQQRGNLTILSDGEFQEQVTVLKQKFKEKKEREKTLTEEILEKERVRKAAEDHNRRVEIQKETNRLIDSDMHGDATEQRLLEPDIEEKVEVPKSDGMGTISRSISEENRSSSSAPDISDTELDQLVKEVAAEKNREANKNKKRGKRQKTSKVELSSEEVVPGNDNEDND